MSDASAITLGQVVLATYAALLGLGGLMGYLKAGSKPSLIAGSASAAVALAALAASFSAPRWAFVVGAALAAAMLVVFAIRLRKSGKFMPSGLLSAASVAALAALAWAAWRIA